MDISSAVIESLNQCASVRKMNEPPFDAAIFAANIDRVPSANERIDRE